MLQIDELNLRLPGLTPDDAHRLGNEVAQRLSAQWPTGMADQHLTDLTVRLTAPPNASQSQLADAIVAQILNQLQLATR